MRELLLTRTHLALVMDYASGGRIVLFVCLKGGIVVCVSQGRGENRSVWLKPDQGALV